MEVTAEEIKIHSEIGNSQHIEDFIDHIADIIYLDYGGDKNGK